MIRDVQNTILFKQLRKAAKQLTKAGERPLSPDNIEVLCTEASQRMRLMPAFHSQYTLHDDTHLLRVTELMGHILGPKHQLNALEIALLILAAHFHDQGMLPDGKEVEAVRGSAEYRMHREQWRIEHPNVREIEQQLAAAQPADELELALKLAELEQAIWSDFLRIRHGEGSARFIRERYGNDKRLEADGISVADLLATLCESHVLNPADVAELPLDKLVGTHKVNVRFLALVLRLADILDFDRERTPDALYRTIHFTSEVSIREWEKHLGVMGRVIGPDLIRFEMAFKHPVYERSARQFLDYIDFELGSAFEIVKAFPAEFERYKLPLPLRVDRSRIGPRNRAYVYHDLEFSLSRDEIVKLAINAQPLEKVKLAAV